MSLKTIASVSLIALGLSLSACGGGGSSAPNTWRAPLAPPPSSAPAATSPAADI